MYVKMGDVTVQDIRQNMGLIPSWMKKTNLIIEFSVVQVTEVTSSDAMEYEGCKRTLNSIIKKKIAIRCLTRDHHTTITAKMRSNYPKITHQYDVWHISKWITKVLTKKAKKKGCEELLP